MSEINCELTRLLTLLKDCIIFDKERMDKKDYMICCVFLSMFATPEPPPPEKSRPVFICVFEMIDKILKPKFSEEGLKNFQDKMGKSWYQ